MSLAKKVKGLPQFMLKNGFWREKVWLGRTLGAMGLHVAGVSYCHEHATDGHLPPEDELAQALGVREREMAKALPELLDREIWVQTPSGFEISGYLEEHPSADEIAAEREKNEAKGLKGNHQRWHVERNVVDPNCDWCRPSPPRSQVSSLDDRRKDRHNDRPGTPTASRDVPHGSHAPHGPDAEEPTPPVVTRESAPPSAAGGGNDTAQFTATEAVRLRADLEVETEHLLGRPPASDTALAAHIRRRLYRDVGDALIGLARRRPELEPAQLYDALMAEQAVASNNEFTRKTVRALAADAAVSFLTAEELVADVVEHHGESWATEAVEVFRTVRAKAAEQPGDGGS